MGSADAVLDFERPLVELERRIAELEATRRETGADLEAGIAALRAELARLRERVFRELSPAQRVRLSRHPGRPSTLDYVAGLFTDWVELHGDRLGRDDPAIVAGLARFRGRPVAVVGHQKGRNTRENLHRNFGSPLPEGYRKALRVMRLAARFGRPVISFVDTQGAFPGVEAEERGQAEAIARNLLEMADLPVPVVACLVGEGGSGGALAIAVGNRVLMLEHATYSVITPEGCAAILWRDRAAWPEAAAALGLTAADCRRLGVVDEVIPEPPGGAHRDPEGAVAALGEALARHLGELRGLDADGLRRDRAARFRRLGAVVELPEEDATP